MEYLMEERYLLVFDAIVPEEFREDVQAAIEKHIRESDCTTCSQKDNCSYLRGDLPVSQLSLTVNDNIDAITNIVNALYPNPDINFIILFDIEANICYLYKAKGDFTLLKETLLIDVKSKINMIKSFDVDEYRDIRDAMELGVYKKSYKYNIGVN